MICNDSNYFYIVGVVILSFLVGTFYRYFIKCVLKIERKNKVVKE